MRAAWIDQVATGVVLGLVLGGTVLARVAPAAFEERYVVEDGPIESLTVLALVTGAAICIVRLARRRVRTGRGTAVTIVLALLFVFGAGEEVSWGQRLFDVESPGFFAKHNAQGETNLHNLVIGGVKINKLVFSRILSIFNVVLWFVLPLAYARRERVRRFVDRWGIPVPRWIHVATFLLALLLVELAPSPRRFELMEWAGCATFVLLVWRPRNAAATPTSSP